MRAQGFQPAIRLVLLLALALLLSASRAAASRPTPAEVRAAVAPVLDSAARLYNVSFSVGWADGLVDEAIGIEAGFPEGTARTLVPVGSSTKPWTAVAVLQVGADADTRKHPCFIKAHCNTRFSEVWR